MNSVAISPKLRESISGKQICLGFLSSNFSLEWEMNADIGAVIQQPKVFFRNKWARNFLGVLVVKKKKKRIHLPMQETWVWSLIRKDPTCLRATKSVDHSYWNYAPEPGSHWAHMPTTTEPCMPCCPCATIREATAMRSLRAATRG